MAALDLHRAIFAHEKHSNLALRSATSFLHPSPESDGSPTGQLFSSTAYQDLIQRQPTHPDGPTSGWDLGLNLLGDPVTPAEYKSLADHRTKMKLRRLHAINIAFELLFGIWGMYTTIRYFLAFDDGLGDGEHVCALILGIMSAVAVALMIISTLTPLFPRHGRLRAWRYTRSLFRVSYLLLLFAGAMVNLVLVLAWHPSQLCHWDLDISWYTSATSTVTSPCHTASFAAWISAAVLRLIVTLTMAFSFIYTLRSYHQLRYPTDQGNGPRYSPYLSDPEEISPTSISSPLRFSKSVFKFTRSEDSNHTLNQSNITFLKSTSISTLAPSTSCTGHSRSHSTPPPKDVSLPRISPPTSRKTLAHTATHGSATQPGSEFQTQFVTAPPPTSYMLRRTSSASVTQVAPDTMTSDMSPRPERFHAPSITCDPPEVLSGASWKPGHHGNGVHPDVRKAAPASEQTHVRHASQTSVGSESLSTTHDDGESTKEKGKDSVVVYSYGYGASGPTYPYLDMYNPQRPGARCADVPSYCEEVDEDGFLQGHRRAVPVGPVLPQVSSEPRSSPSREDEDEEEDEEESSGEEEEYVAMMGGFVRRMATIESLGSREAAGTLSTTCSVASPHSMRSGAPASSTSPSQFSSVRFADVDSTLHTPSMGVSSAGECSLSTVYLSFSSGGTGVWVNERGELLRNPGTGKGSPGSPYDRQYYTASGSSFPRVDDEDR